MNRQDLENKADELRVQTAEMGVVWADAKVTYHNLNKLSSDLESSIMNRLEVEQTLRDGKELPNVKLRRLAHATEQWKEHKTALNLAYENELRARLKYKDLKTEWDITYAKYLKS